jgi:GTP-binding protein
MTADVVKKLFRGEIKFIAGASRINQLPKIFLPEIAFVGKSNVGKSSLINALFNRGNLAKVSHTPGRTQQINFFSLIDKVVIVDLPGYGFAKVPSSIKLQWEKLINHYLENRSNLKLVNLLIDSRRGIKQHDMEVAKLLLLYEKNFQIIFTKYDKVNNKEILVNDVKIFLENLNYSCNVICTSSRSKEGAREVQCSMFEYI